VFNLYGTDRLVEWQQFRNTLETSDSPLEAVAEFWAHAPFVNSYLDPKSPETWPDPWHLVIDCKLDDLAITLGMLYTISLTQRFNNTHFKILELKDEDPHYILVINDSSVLNLEYRAVVDISTVNLARTSIIWEQ
jgi:hypothetical protein